MKNQAKHSAARFRGFYTALGISLAMIGAACFFAYRQTSSTLEENLNSLTEIAELPMAAVTDQIQAPVIGVKTDVAKETQTVTSAAAQTQAETQAETEALTDAPETQPEAEAPAHHLTAPLTEYTVLAPFSAGELVKSETTGTWQTHNGVDLACEAGSDVYAIDIGTVSSVCNDALWGYTVTIDHDNGVTSRYCGLDGSLEVREGDAVQSGQKLGTAGNTADIESSQDSHLHLEIRRSGEYLDPMAYLQ